MLNLSMINQTMRQLKKKKIENFQYRACIAVTGAIQGTPKSVFIVNWD